MSHVSACWRAIARVLVVACSIVHVPAPAGAQAGDTARRLDFSGVMYANYQRRTDSLTKAANGGQPATKFDIERVYLTFRMPAGNRASMRVTTDIFVGDQSSVTFYRGWAVRLKYAYLQLGLADNFLGVAGLGAAARVGMMQTVQIEHEEQFWPRYLGSAGVERNGFFSSADVGASLLLTLPNRWGESYSVITNGNGYAVAESDRFQDYASRLTITPFSNSDGIVKTLALTGWVYSGQTGSRFRAGGAGQVGPVPDGLRRDRIGAFAGLRDRRLTVGVGLAQRTETLESGDNTSAVPRTTVENTGRLTYVFASVRPGAWTSPASRAASWGILGKVDHFKPDTDSKPANQFTVASLFWDANSRLTFSLDHQAQSRKNGSTTAETSILFLRLQALF
jgi:hypothetical protein